MADVVENPFCITYMSSQILYDGEIHTDVATGYSSNYDDYHYYSFNKPPKALVLYTNAFINYKDLKDADYVENGLHITITKSNHTIKVVGTATADTYIRIGYPSIKQHHIYEVSGCPNNGGSKDTFYFGINNTTSVDSKSWHWFSYETNIINSTSKKSIYGYLYIVIKKGTLMRADLEPFIPEINDTVCIDSNCNGVIWKKWSTDLSGNSFDVVFPNDRYYEYVNSLDYKRDGWGTQSQSYILSDIAFQDVDGLVCEQNSVSNTYNMQLKCCAGSKYGMVFVHEKNTDTAIGVYRYGKRGYIYLKDSNTDEYYWDDKLYLSNGSTSHYCDGSTVPSANGGFLIPQVSRPSGATDTHVYVHNFTYNESSNAMEDNVVFDGYGSVYVKEQYNAGNNISFVEDLSPTPSMKKYVVINDGFWYNTCYHPVSLVSSTAYIDFDVSRNSDDTRPFTDCALIPRYGFRPHYNIPVGSSIGEYTPHDSETSRGDPRYLKACKELYDIAFPKRRLHRPDMNYSETWDCQLLSEYAPLVIGGEIKMRQTYQCTTSYLGRGAYNGISETYLVDIIVSIKDTDISISECETEGLPKYKEYIDENGYRQYTTNCLHTGYYKYNNKLYYYQYKQMNPTYKKSEWGSYYVETNPTYNLKVYSTTNNIDFTLEKTFAEGASLTSANRYYKFYMNRDVSSKDYDLNKCSMVRVNLYKDVEYTNRELNFYPERDMLKDRNITTLNLGLFENIMYNGTLRETVSRIHSQEYMMKFVGTMPSISSNSEFIIKVKYEYPSIDINDESIYKKSTGIGVTTIYAYLVFDSPLLNSLRGFHISNQQIY